MLVGFLTFGGLPQLTAVIEAHGLESMQSLSSVRLNNLSVIRWIIADSGFSEKRRGTRCPLFFDSVDRLGVRADTNGMMSLIFIMGSE